jgi:hypothetical protein
MFRQIKSVNFINFPQFLRVILPPAVKDESPYIFLLSDRTTLWMSLFFIKLLIRKYTGYFMRDNEPDGIENATHNTFPKLP